MTPKWGFGNITLTVKVERAHLIIEGRVQGVFFRACAKEQADELKLNGWVRNLPGGLVEIQVEGWKENLERFLDWCHAGSPDAVVTNVSVKYLQPTGEFGSFNIEY